jgi:tripartite-type tricarboxylate transporter receptor subunit TctC
LFGRVARNDSGLPHDFRSLFAGRTGAGGNIGAEAAYHSAPDGYTLLSSPPPPLVINQNLYPKLGFDPAKFEPVIVMAHVPNALIVNPGNLKASSVSELVEYLRQNPEKVTAATQGNGTTSHLTAALFQVTAKVKLRFVPYRGSAPALQGLLAGDVDLMFDNLSVSLPLVEAGNLKLLWPHPSACRRFPMCRRSQRRCRDSRRLPGTRSWRHRPRRKPSRKKSTRM